MHTIDADATLERINARYDPYVALELERQRAAELEARAKAAERERVDILSI